MMLNMVLYTPRTLQLLCPIGEMPYGVMKARDCMDSDRIDDLGLFEATSLQ